MQAPAGTTFAAFSASAILRDTPILLPDTCAIGDILREPHRSNHKGKSIEAARVLADASANGRVTIAIAQRVLEEWTNHRQGLVLELERGVRNLDDAVVRLHEATVHAGSTIPFPRPAYDVVAVSNAVTDVADNLVREAHILAQEDPSLLRGMMRAVQLRRPARKGQTAHDCEVIEHYFGACRELRNAGFTRPIVFVTSNTNDYCETGVTPHGDLAPEFGSLDLDFVTDMAWARRQLGL